MNMSPQILEAIRQRDGELIQRSGELIEQLRRSHERQIRNILEVAERATCWEAVEIFIRYQAARKQIDREWVGPLIDALKKLEGEARKIAEDLSVPPDQQDQIKAIHLVLIARFLGYLLRWDKIRFAGQEVERAGTV